MTTLRITNCHVHCFTEAHVPRRFPHPALGAFKRHPVLVRGLARLAGLIGQEGLAENLTRLARFGAETLAGSQSEILGRLAPLYPRTARFVVLPMAMAASGHGPVAAGIAAQHDELAALAASPEWAGRLIPFASIDPRLPGAAAEVRRAIETLGFRGLKLYPRLGFAPDHPVLMEQVYPLLQARGLPVVSHCSRGGVTGRGLSRAVADGFSAPQAFLPVLRAFPGLRVNLAHFGGADDWRAFVDGVDVAGGNWLEALRAMLISGEHPGLWTDISYTLFETEAYLPFLKLFLEDARIARRVLFGSDYYMTRQEALSERAVAVRLRVGLGEAAFRQIAETNPEIWLGERPENRPSQAAALALTHAEADGETSMAAHGQAQPMTAGKSGPLSGTAAVPGDKSISHRALILGAMAVGETRITGLLEGQDVLDTAAAMRAFGADVERLGAGAWVVNGVGVGGFREPDGVIDCGNSGTGVRLIMGCMATTAMTATFTGDASLRKRPMGRVTDPLALFGARAYGRQGGRLPMTIVGAANPVPVRYALPVASAQVKSAVLLAGLNAPGETVVIEREPTRDHSERMLLGFGADLTVEQTAEGHVITLKGQPELRPQVVAVPRDPSSAAFPVCAALIVPGSDILVPGVSQNLTRNGLYLTLVEMGAEIEFQNPRSEGGEPVADLRVRFSGAMRGIEVPPERAPSMIDEYPILSVVAAFAEGPTVMRGVKELRVKESDRIDAMARGLEACGVRIEEDQDTLIVHGMGPGGVPGGATCATHIDHRIAMSFLICGMAAQKPVSVDDASPIVTSFPGFEGLMTGLGASLSQG